MELLEHNADTLFQVESFVARKMNCCVVNPCGSGKTSIMEAFVKNHESASFLLLTKQGNAAEYYKSKDPVFSEERVHIVTFSKMLSDMKKGRTAAYKRDFYLVDEAHYIGATRWKNAFTSLTECFHPILIGFTATPQRYEDRGTDRDVVKEYFGGNYAGNFTTAQLEEKGLFVKPDYVLSLYNLQKMVESSQKRIMLSDMDETQKMRYLDRLDAILRTWQTNSAPQTILKKTLPKYMYKECCNRILVYVPSISELRSRRNFIDLCIKAIFPGKEIRSYSYTYKDSKDVLDEYLKEDSAFIKVLYSIDKIMETVHIDDLRIAIMLRPSTSSRIIVQQFGRLNSLGNKTKPLIIDMVDNIGNLQRIPKMRNSFNDDKSACSHKKSHYEKLPHIQRYANVFSEIDGALSGIQRYTYQWFTGTLREICYVFRVNYQEAVAMLGGNNIDAVIAKAKTVPCATLQRVIDGESADYDFQMSETQMMFANANENILNDFIENRGITDDDMRQDLYIRYLYEVHKTESRPYSPSRRKHMIMIRLYNFYLAECRNRATRNSLWVDKSVSQPTVPEEELWDNVDNGLSEMKKVLWAAIETLTPRERKVLISIYGLDGSEPESFASIGRSMSTNRQNVYNFKKKAFKKIQDSQFAPFLVQYLRQKA